VRRNTSARACLRLTPNPSHFTPHAPRIMNLSLGPLLYYWSREDTFAFYEAAASWPVARI